MRLDPAEQRNNIRLSDCFAAKPSFRWRKRSLIPASQPAHGVKPSETDAKRMLEAFLEIELSGATNEDARAHARAALRLSPAPQHKRTADFRTAALCAKATFLVINIVAILGGRRTP